MSNQSRSTHSQCHVMAKPSSSVCNLDCEYCFYLEKENLYPERKKNWRMSDETLEAYIKQNIDAQDNVDVDFSWQGGEPTLLGLEFFQKAIELQEKYKGSHRIHNAFQTNGILLNDEWCQFLKKHNFLIGISIDGPAELHDNYRVNRAGRPSHAKVMDSIALLKKHGVNFNTLTVVNAENVKHPEKVYDFLTGIGSTFLQFIPIVERKSTEVTKDGLQLVNPNFEYEANVTPWSAPSKQYGEFLNRIFDHWIKKDVGRIFVNIFDNTLATWCKEPANLCTFSETCGHAFVLEANGDLYNCDHFVYPEHLVGNIHESSIRELNQDDKAFTFGQDKKDKLTKQCVECEFRFACHGGCPKHRFITSKSGQPGHNYFCEGYESYFRHTERYMKMMRDLLISGRPASDVMMQLYQQQISVKKNSLGRNAPCPCGSGKKSKRCCSNLF
ncbi:anaerobic sulfatase maturase [Photobacterium sagamiensis]|uniref:anaerobic sulfatase maturase n=1 Tax=Photobacterium sagamiensis TaxID=2910241 RepID=UPI003D11B4EC